MRPAEGPGQPEGMQLYASRCSVSALKEILGDEGRVPEYLGCGTTAQAGHILEPFASVVCNGYIASMIIPREKVVNVCPGSALPLAYCRAFEGEAGDGE